VLLGAAAGGWFGAGAARCCSVSSGAAFSGCLVRQFLGRGGYVYIYVCACARVRGRVVCASNMRSYASNAQSRVFSVFGFLLF